MNKTTEQLVRLAAVLFIAVTAVQAGTLLGEIIALQLSRDSPCSHLEV